MEEKRKTVTSTEVKRRYNQKVYSQISFSAPKVIISKFRFMNGSDKWLEISELVRLSAMIVNVEAITYYLTILFI